MGETTMRFFSSISRIRRGVNRFIFPVSIKVLRREYSMLAAAVSLAVNVVTAMEETSPCIQR